MLRFYFLGDDLDDLEAVSSELQAAGIAAEQIYVVTDSYDEVDRRNFNHVWSVARKDTVRSAIIGAFVGVCLAALVLVGAWTSGIAESYTWTPFVFLAVVVLGFCTWEGGLWGIQEPHHEFKRFQSELENGRHLLLVEASDAQSSALDSVCEKHSRLTPVGEGKAVPGFMRLGHILFNRYRAWGP
ncbi:MAG: NAD/FAD-utilizing enzyme [Pseudomonadota bacterium]